MASLENLKKLFLQLTEYTIPFGYEKTLEKYLPNGYKKDSIGNYYYEIGESETLFTTHLDTYSKKYQKVNHVIEDDFIGTDEKTILGGDNKLGTSILINMINENIPGTYYFFLGEEPTTPGGGLYGSRNALSSNPNFFKKFKRAIAFDRREYGSIVTRQKARNCCSMEFAEAIADNLKKYSNIEWDKKGGFGYYTDTAVFMDVIPEITNLSVGGFKEHHLDEYADLAYTFRVLTAALKIDWESLPIVRVLDVDELKEKSQSYNIINKYKLFHQNILIDQITNIMDLLDLSLVKKKNIKDYLELTFSKWLEDFDIKIIIDNKNKILIDNKIFSIHQFTDYIINEYSEEIIDSYEYYSEHNPTEAKLILKKLKCKTEDDFYKKFS